MILLMSISRILQKVLEREGCKRYKKQKVPGWSEEKKVDKTRTKMPRTTMKSSSRSFRVKDDESYFPFEHSEMPGYDRFYSKDKTPAEAFTPPADEK